MRVLKDIPKEQWDSLTIQEIMEKANTPPPPPLGIGVSEDVGIKESL